MATVSIHKPGIRAGDTVTIPNVRKASGFAELLGAFALVQENYVRLRYKGPDTGLYHFNLYNLHPRTRTLVGVLDGVITGTCTLVPDSEMGLPFAGVFPDVYESIRREGHRPCEATMLADRRMSLVRSWPQLRAIFRLVLEVAKHQQLTRLLVLCHPHHATFYLHRLPFEQAADVRPCPHVGGSPAVPLVLDLTPPGLIGQIDEALDHWGAAVEGDDAAHPEYQLNDQRAAALVAINPPVLREAPPVQRRVIEACYPTLHRRLRFLDVGQFLVCL